MNMYVCVKRETDRDREIIQDTNRKTFQKLLELE